MRFFLFLLTLTLGCLLSTSSFAILPFHLQHKLLAQSNSFHLHPWSLPPDADFNNYENIIITIGWKDKLGQNRLILSQSNKTARKTNLQCSSLDNCFNTKISVKHFLEQKSDLHLVRKIYDFARDCSSSPGIAFIDNSLTITDLDLDGIAEISFIYRISCNQVKYQNVTKFLMLENSKKYAIRSKNFNTNQFAKRIDHLPNTISTEYKIDRAFNSAPISFLEFAKLQWIKYVKSGSSD